MQGEVRAARSSFAKQMGAVNITLLCRELLQAAHGPPPHVMAQQAAAEAEAAKAAGNPDAKTEHFVKQCAYGDRVQAVADRLTAFVKQAADSLNPQAEAAGGAAAAAAAAAAVVAVPAVPSVPVPVEEAPGGNVVAAAAAAAAAEPSADSGGGGSGAAAAASLLTDGGDSRDSVGAV